MDTKELENKYRSLYEYMATSGKTDYMKLFGEVMNEMMNWMIDNKAEAASEWIDKLGAIMWHNYLTRREADKIISYMQPKAPWGYSTWQNVMDSLGLMTEEPPCYNSCALWVTMNMIYSDSSDTIAKIIGQPLESISQEKMVKSIYMLAVDKLKDKDHVFRIRHYFDDILR
jgi:hypothetical protein